MGDQLMKLARLAHGGTSMKAISQIFNVDESKILQLIETSEYSKSLSEVAGEEAEKAALLDKGWDGIEELAMSNVVNALRHNPDPDYAIKAASLANKAIRRNGVHGMKQNTPIQVNQNLQAVIHIQPVFAKTLQENYLVEDVKEVAKAKKVVNALNPAAVKNLLMPLTSMNAIADDLLDDVMDGVLA